MVITRRQKKLEAKKKILHAWKCFNMKDPILLQRIQKKFILIRNSCNILFDAYTLFIYINNSGDYRDPITRMEYDDIELQRLSYINTKDRLYLIKKKSELLEKRESIVATIALCEAFEAEFYGIVETFINAEYTSGARDNLNMYIPWLIQCFENYRQLDAVRCEHFVNRMKRNITQEPFISAEISSKLLNLLTILLSYCRNDMY